MTAPEKDILISRLVDGEASREDWCAFRTLAEADNALWRDLAEAQKDQSDLTQMVGAAVAVSDGVEAPVESRSRERFRGRLRLAANWGGWAVAAAVAIAAVGGWLKAPGAGVTTDPRNTGDLGSPFKTAADAFAAYMAKGQAEGSVLGESPAKVLVSKSPAANGGFEVVYLRQILERSVVPDLYQFAYDEAGRAVPVPIEQAPTGRGPI